MTSCMIQTDTADYRASTSCVSPSREKATRSMLRCNVDSAEYMQIRKCSKRSFSTQSMRFGQIVLPLIQLYNPLATCARGMRPANLSPVPKRLVHVHASLMQVADCIEIPARHVHEDLHFRTGSRSLFRSIFSENVPRKEGAVRSFLLLGSARKAEPLS